MDIETVQAKYTALPNLGILVEKQLTEDYAHLIPPTIKKDEAVNLLEKELTDAEIMDHITNCCQMALVASEACNFRCYYCAYSGKYKNDRQHSEQKMSMETARKAIDLFLNLSTGKNRKTMKKSLSLSFYGGESLLEFQTVKDTIEYAETQTLKRGLTPPYEIQFRLSTNGFLLNGTMVDFFKSKNVFLDISLDGPASEHDRFRVTKGGMATWDTIITNLKYLKEKYPDYYQQRVQYLAVQHPLHNSQLIDSFFSDNPDLFQDKLPHINLLKLKDLPPDEAALYKEMKFKPCKLYREKVYQGLGDKFTIRKRKNGIGLTPTCFPGGEKILVNADGSLSICEKIGNSGPKIGHVDTGFDFSSIRQILKEYGHAIINSHCWDCPIWFLCDKCFANTFDGHSFTIDCDVPQSYSNLLKHFLEEKEQQENQEQGMDCGSVVEFIQQL